MMTAERAGRVEVSGGRLAGWILFAAVLCLGIADGVYRAANNLPSILGDESTVYTTLFERSADDGWTKTPFGFELTALPQGMKYGQRGMGEHCDYPWRCQSHLVCRDGQCLQCQSDDDCRVRNPLRQCFNTTRDSEDTTVCEHKPLLYPVLWEDIVLCILAFVVSALGGPTGTGGGGILVPAFIMIGRFSPHAAVPLSKACIVGGAIVNNFFNIQRRHPFANRPLINYDLLVIVSPSLLSGSILGVLLNKVSPNWVIITLLVASLSLSTYYSFHKARALYIEEEQEARAGEEQRLLSGHQTAARHYSHDDDDASLPSEVRTIVHEEREIDYRWLGVAVLVWGLVFVCSSLKEFAVECGTWQYFIIAFFPVPIVVILSWHVGNSLNERFEKKRQVGYRFADGDMMWTLANVRIMPAMGFLIGISAGALGIAAGTLLGPLLLELGLLPMVSVGTTGLMVLFTSSSTTVQYTLLGLLKIDYALCFAVLSTTGGAVGNVAVYALVKKYNKTWFVVAILCAMIGISTLLLAITGINRSFESWIVGADMGFQPLCRHFTF